VRIATACIFPLGSGSQMMAWTAAVPVRE